MAKRSTTGGKLGVELRMVAFVDTWWRRVLRHKSVLYSYVTFVYSVQGFVE